MQKQNSFINPIFQLFGTLFLILASYSSGESAVSTGAQFLEIPGGVRGSGMGGMFTAVADDVTTTYWNTAGLGLLKNMEVNLEEVSYFASLNFNFAGLAFPLSPGSVLGFSASYDFVPPFNSTNNPSAIPGSEEDFSLDLGYGQTFGKNLALGVGAKFFSSTLLTDSAYGGAADAGLLLYTDDRAWTLGLSMQNLGQISSYTSNSSPGQLPLDFRAGLAYRFQPEKPTNFLLGIDLEQMINEDPLVHVGGEAWVGSKILSVAFRAGYTFDPSTQALGGDIGASLGAGARYQGLEFNYALVPEGFLGVNNWVSLTYRFGSQSHAAKPTPTPLSEKISAISLKPQIGDYQSGTIKQATFELKPQARTEIKNWILDIKDPLGKIIRSYSGKGVPPKQLAWDGKDNNGNVVNGGIFANYSFRTEDVRGQQVEASESVFNVTQVSPREANLLASVEKRVFVAPVLPEALFQMKSAGNKIQVPFVSFGYKSDNINPGYFKYLDEVSQWIQKYPDSSVYLEGNAFEEGSENDCKRLSQNRADAVLRYLVEKGKIPSGNLYSRGHGSSSPLDMSGSQEALFKNRRVDIVILVK